MVAESGHDFYCKNKDYIEPSEVNASYVASMDVMGDRASSWIQSWDEVEFCSDNQGKYFDILLSLLYKKPNSTIISRKCRDINIDLSAYLKRPVEDIRNEDKSNIAMELGIAVDHIFGLSMSKRALYSAQIIKELYAYIYEDKKTNTADVVSAPKQSRTKEDEEKEKELINILKAVLYKNKISKISISKKDMLMLMDIDLTMLSSENFISDETDLKFILKDRYVSEHQCEGMKKSNSTIKYNKEVGEYNFVLENGEVIAALTHCPYCFVKLDATLLNKNLLEG